ncbi:arsenate reductase family protein [Parvularcula dongshanensis]|uniref:Arsenate reductase n=1 Tax=Parvularcula dongshanensis TaxID=1173995 RepID=A0A840I6Q3_9PROT|nr:arsenate reductase family protein [Parvularcula dongshanensis]MBB4659923.1 arsenate reductase [Parvularcula dongshanensis]
MTVTIYHNPNCGTSRNALAIVRASGDAARGIEVIEYLKTPPTRERLAQLYAAAGLSPREGLRTKGNEAILEAEGLTLADADPSSDAERVLAAMTRHPILINRPLVEGPRGTVLARPSERVAEVLKAPPTAWTKEDGETVRLGTDE